MRVHSKKIIHLPWSHLGEKNLFILFKIRSIKKIDTNKEMFFDPPVDTFIIKFSDGIKVIITMRKPFKLTMIRSFTGLLISAYNMENQRISKI